MSKCPRLREIVGSFADILEDNPDKLSTRDVTLYLENLLTFFFSPLSSELNDNDVRWFLEYLNISQAVIQVHLPLRVEGEGPVPKKDQSPLLNALSTGMAKRVLGEILTHLQEDETPVPPLNIFCGKVGSFLSWSHNSHVATSHSHHRSWLSEFINGNDMTVTLSWFIT